MDNKILIIIDPQNDFILGSLSVNGAIEAMNKLSNFIIEHGRQYSKIVLTADWHPITHCSFIENGGKWPIHCVQFSIGASLYEPIMNALKEIEADYTILTKGLNEDREEYSIFKNPTSCDKIMAICNDVKNIDMCGIAYDVCLFDSAKDALRALPNANIHILKEFSPSISEEGAKNVDNFVKNFERITI